MKGIDSTSPVATTVPSSEAGNESFTYDPEFKGPVKDRSCTDIICLFLFVSFIAGWAVVSIFAFKYGDPRILLNPTDSNGNICGMYQYEDKPFLFFFDLTKCATPKVIFNGCPTEQVCVKSCPTENFMVTPTSGNEVKEKMICVNGTDMSKPVSELLNSKSCASMYLSSKPIVKRCVPNIFMKAVDDMVINDKNNEPMKDENGNKIMIGIIRTASKNLARFLNAQEFGKQVFHDFKACGWIILLVLFLCMFLCLIWIVLMQWIAGCMIYVSILAVTGFSAFCCYFSVSTYLAIKNKAEEPGSYTDFTKNLGLLTTSKKTWLVFAIVSGSLFVILLLILIFLRTRVRIAIALIKEASRAVSCMLSTLAFPIIPYLLQVAVISFWAATALYIASSGRATFVISEAQEGSSVKNGTECKPWDFNITTAKCQFLSYGKDNLSGSQLYNLFAMLWAVFFIIGIGEMSLAGAFSSYYWTMDKKSSAIPFGAVTLGFYRCLRYHLGSVAFGSLLIATVRFIRIVLEYINKKCKKFDNQVTRAIMWCMRCCFWCLEKFVKFISKNAYIMIAVYGKNFCSSAKMAFMLLFRNALRVVVLDKVTDFLLLFGKLAIVGASASLSFLIFVKKIGGLEKVLPELHFNMMPVLVITIGSYFIASIFFNVYSMAVNTLFLCFLEDIERNDGSSERPYYMSKELMKILDKSNKFREPAN